MKSKLAIIVTGALSIIAAWLPWIELQGTSQNGLMGDLQGIPALFLS